MAYTTTVATGETVTFIDRDTFDSNDFSPVVDRIYCLAYDGIDANASGIVFAISPDGIGSIFYDNLPALVSEHF